MSHGPSFDELETDITIHTSTGSILKYKYVRSVNGTPVVRRTLITPQGENTVVTSIADVLSDGRLITGIATHFEKLNSLNLLNQ